MVIKLVDLLERFKNMRYRPVRKMIHSSEVNVSTQRQEKHNAVDIEDVHRQEDVSV